MTGTPDAPPPAATAPSAPPAPATLGELRASGHVLRSVKAELRDNLLAALATGRPTLPGIVGFADTVLPQVERAILAGHDIVLLGERGQGKTRIARTLVQLLDEWTPEIAGTEVHDHPYAPVSAWGRRLVAERGDDTPVAWLHRSFRYGEKLATPDTGVGDLIGDVDPVKVAEGRTLGDPETVHFGLVPRTNRGIFAINELPDLAERIQVSLLNVLEERDVQIRGYVVRLPLDLLVIGTANPEDYTNRGRIITPLKDRFGAEVRTHYPLRLDDEIGLIQQEALTVWEGSPLGEPVLPLHLLETVARFTRLVRDSPQIDRRSGVSARFAVASAETVVASAVRRAALTGETQPVARVSDLPAVLPAVRGKVEFESTAIGAEDEGREVELLAHLLRRAVAETFRARLAGTDLSGLQERFADGSTVETGELVPAAELLARIGPVPGLAQLMAALDDDGAESPGLAAAALEFALEGLHLTRRLAKDEVPGRTVYGG